MSEETESARHCFISSAWHSAIGERPKNLEALWFVLSYLFQVEGARDIAKTLEQRESTDGTSAYHTLKLALGDGAQTVI